MFSPPLPIDQTGERFFSCSPTLRLGFDLLFHPARRANELSISGKEEKWLP
jgi:hypothetical protein